MSDSEAQILGAEVDRLREEINQLRSELLERLKSVEEVVVEATRRRFQGHDYWPGWVAELFPDRHLYVPGKKEAADGDRAAP